MVRAVYAFKTVFAHMFQKKLDTNSSCSLGKMMSPIMDQLAEEYKGRVTFAKVDLDTNQALAMRFNVQGVPHFQVWKNGSKVEEFSGADANQLRYLVKLHSLDVEADLVQFTTIPITSYALSELTTPIQGPLKKIAEFNDSQAISKVPELKLSPEELEALTPLLEHLFAKDHTYVPNTHHYAALEKFARWPAEVRIPALDILRSAFAHPLICEHFLAPFVSNSEQGNVIQDCLRILCSEKVTNLELRMLWRFVTNLVASDHLRDSIIMGESIKSIFPRILSEPKTEDAALALSLADAFLNITIAVESAPRNDETNYLITMALEVCIRLMTIETDENALCRLLVALGSVVIKNPPFQVILCGNSNLKNFLLLKQNTCKIEHNLKVISELLKLISKPL